MGKKKHSKKKQLPVVQHDSSALVINEATLRSRIASAVSGGYDNADTLHNIFLDFGYPTTLTFGNFWNMYRRFGIARNLVELPVETSWTTPPVVTGSDQFNSELEKMVTRLKLWKRLKGLDTRQRVGRYAGLFMRVADGQQPDKPLNGMPSGAAIVSITPLYEGQLKVLETDTNPGSPTYDQPTMYQYSTGGVGDRDERSQSSFSIHHSRLVMAAEGADDGGIYGIPALESSYNSLMDLRKIIGAGGEGFYRNASQSVVFNLKDTASANVNTELLGQFNEKFDEFTKDRMRKAMWTPGLEAKVLEAILPNPEHFFLNALQDVAASCKIPSTILIGQQTGRLASNEDSRGYLSGINSRRTNYLDEMLSDFIDWCITYGALPSSEYTILWDDLLAVSDQERLENARQCANINRENYQSGGEMVFSSTEIRKKAGFSGEAEGDIEVDIPDETLPEDVDG